MRYSSFGVKKNASICLTFYCILLNYEPFDFMLFISTFVLTNLECLPMTKELSKSVFFTVISHWWEVFGQRKVLANKLTVNV